MHIALIADAYPPMRTSGAVQLRDLAQEFLRQDHHPTVLVPSCDIEQAWVCEIMDGVEVLRLRAPQTKDIGYVRRTVGEFLMPYAMLRNLRKSPFSDVRWDGVVWYSPTIFLGPIANTLKKASACRSYLIVRDIFPEWAVDMGLLGRGLPYRFFKANERRQYAVADVIGVQTPANLPYFDVWASLPGRRAEVLQNWLSEAPKVGCSISVAKVPLAGRTIFVYAGNMGVAQGMDCLIDLALRLRSRTDAAFLFVGRGSDAQRLRALAAEQRLDNVQFVDEVDADQIPGLLSQCHVGLIALDPRHTTHNIPGKLLTYLHAGLPVLARINPGNDLEGLINDEGIGRVVAGDHPEELLRHAEALLSNPALRASMGAAGRLLVQRIFSPASAVRQVVHGLTGSE